MLLSSLLLNVAASAHAADLVLNVEDGKFNPDAAKMRVGDRLVVANRSDKRLSVWGHADNWAFDYRATPENGWTHEPGQSLGVVLNIPGKYRIGNALDGKMRATVIVEQ